MCMHTHVCDQSMHLKTDQQQQQIKTKFILTTEYNNSLGVNLRKMHKYNPTPA